MTVVLRLTSRVVKHQRINTHQVDLKKKTCSEAKHEVSGLSSTSKGKQVYLRCSECKEAFSSAWDLMFHVQNAHGINLYKLDGKEKVSFIQKRTILVIVYLQTCIKED